MTYGIRLTGTHRDLAALHTLAEGHDALVMTPWTTLSPAPPATASVLTTEALDAAAAQRLRARGVDVVRVTRSARGASFTGSRAAPTERYEPCDVREARTLVEAVRPVRAHGDPACEEALFHIPLAGDGAQRTLERLLALGRDDFTLAETDSAEHGGRVLLLRVPLPPMYLLLRAREEPAEGITAFARAGDGDVWVEWSWAQPLAHIVSRLVRNAGQMALITRDGQWRFAPAQLPVRSVYDVVVPRFDAPRHDLVPVPGECRFTIRLRLVPAAHLDPELWVLDPEQFLALEPLIEALTQEELSRFTVARTTSPEGTRYVVQEHVRPGHSRLGGRVSDLAASPGFARAVGTDNLYLPPGRQLAPRMRRDELRALLDLDRAQVVVVAEDLDGPRVFTARTLDEAPLARWVDYVATDRRMELERLEEAAVFDWPELQVEKPPKAPDLIEAADRDERPKPPRVRREPVAVVEEAPEPVAAAPEDDAALAALREEIRALEGVLAEGGHDNPVTWRELASRKGRVGETDDAAACLESAMFFDGATVEASAALAAHRGRHLPHTGSREELVALVTRDHLAPAESSWLAARVVESALRGETIVDDSFYQDAARRFSDPETLVSRRLAWVVCRTLHGRTGDRLGLTRARERVLGGVNERGLSDQLDIPRFVRFTLAWQSDGSADVARARLDQIDALEALLTALPAATTRGLDSLPAYLASIFAVGFARLGAGARGHDLLSPVEEEIVAHDAPNRTLLQLYRARYAHAATRADADAWKQEVDAALNAIKEPRVKDRVEWLRKRSEWLRTGVADAVGAAAKQSVERALAEAEAHPERSLDALTTLMDDRSLFDFEARIVGQRMLRVGIRSGNDDLLADLLRATQLRLGRLSHPGHRAELIGECLRAAAVLHDGGGVDALLDAVVTLVRAPDAPATRDLLNAVTPGLAALRRLGAGDSARRFLDALVPSATRGQREGIRLRAALAEGFLLLRDTERADALLDEALDDALAEGLDHVGRHEAGTAVLAALRHWPTAGRTPRCRRVFEALPRFTDSFTASTQRVYETHKILIAERVVDALADEVTVADDRAHAWLADEEQSTRRKILADWREVCGR
jgi:hypothetical protein